MSPAHLHLMTNHIPVIGFVLILFFLSYALWAKSEQVIRPVLFVAVMVGLFAAVAYFTGEPAEESIEHLAGVSESYIEAHEEKAKLAFISAVITSVVAGITLVMGFKRKRTSIIGIWLTLALSLATSLLMGWAASLGGEIRHPEIRSGSDTSNVPAEHEEGGEGR